MRFSILVLIAILPLAAPRGAIAQATPWQMHISVGEQAYREGRYSDAEKAFAAALKEAERLGPDNPRLATSLNNLAVLYKAQGRYRGGGAALPAGAGDPGEGAR